MVNKSLFSSITSILPRATAVNEAGGPAYKFPAKHALAQLAATGTFGNVFYASAQDQLDSATQADQLKSTTTSSWRSWRSTRASERT